MTKSALFALALLALAPVVPAQTASPAPTSSHALMERRNAAAGFAGTVKFSVGRAARTCRDLLGKDDQYMRAIADEWTQRNSRYATAAERWTSMLLTAIAQAQGREAANKAYAQIMTIVQRDAEQSVQALLGTDPEVRKTRCEKLPAVISNGGLDITASAPLYQELQELATLFDQPAAAQ